MEAAPRERNMALGVRIRTAATIMDGIAPVYRFKKGPFNAETESQ
jgi:hypothetical protein